MIYFDRMIPEKMTAQDGCHVTNSRRRGLPVPRRWVLPMMPASSSLAATRARPPGWSRCRAGRWRWPGSPPGCRRRQQTSRLRWPGWWPGWQQRSPIPGKRRTAGELVLAVWPAWWNLMKPMNLWTVAGHFLTKPYAVLLSCSCVMSATYANITEKVTAKTPDMEMTAKYHLQGAKTVSYNKIPKQYC